MSQTIKKELPVQVKSETDNESTGSQTQDQDLNGTSDGWQDIPLKCCTEEEMRDVRYHIMKFHTKQNVDIMGSFTRPVRLHRKDPRNIQFHLTREELERRKKEGVKVEGGSNEGYNGEDTGQKNEIDLSQVAPDGGARKGRRSLFKRKTRQINMMDEEKRRLRYEEYYPWVIEDYDGKNVFVGNYEAGSSDSQHVLFVFDKDGFKMVPTEKVYKFTPRNKYATLTLEEAEAKMEKNSSIPRWLMRHMEENANLEGATPDLRFRHNAAPTNGSSSIFTPQVRPRLRTVTGGGTSNDRDLDHDDLDYDEEFADDEEAPIMDGDEEENKLSEQKIKKEMMKASHFDDQPDVGADDEDLDDLFETEKARKVDKEGKKLRKVLNKTEGGVYDSDDDDNLNPYLSKSDLESESSDEGVQVKVENDDTVPKDKAGLFVSRSFSASNLGNAYVRIKAPSQFLKGFPPGAWNPNVRKRPLSQDSNDNLPDDKRARIKNGLENSRLIDLTSPGPENSLVTVQEVLNIVKDNPLTTKELLLKLRSRVSSHKENKQRIINIVKQNLKLVDGKLVLKE